MNNKDSITSWLGRLNSGDPDAAQLLWERYFEKLVGVAYNRLRAAPQRDASGEDVAISAFASFCRCAKEGRFPQLTDSDGLWKLLVTITARKASSRIKYQQAQRRGGGKVRGESVFGAGDDGPDFGIEQAVGVEPSPEFAATMTESFDHLLESLGDELLREIALKRLEGYENQEIGEALGLSERTVKRKVAVIKTIWSEEKPDHIED